MRLISVSLAGKAGTIVLGAPRASSRADACCWTSAGRLRDKGPHEPFRRRESKGRSAAAAARRAPAADDARRSIGPGASDRTGRRADPPAPVSDAGLDDLLGAAGQRQDDGRAAHRRRARGCFRAGLGDPFGRCGTQKNLRRRAGSPRTRAGHAALCRRDPSLQSGATGFVSAGDGERRRDPDRRDDGKSLVRVECGASVPRARTRLSSPGRPGA